MLLLGKPCVDSIVENYGDVSGVKLCTIGFDNDQWNQYTGSLVRNAQKYGMQCENIVVGNCTPDEFCQIVKDVCARSDVSGVMVQQPLPREYAHAVEFIDVNKDVDCLNPLSVAKLYLGKDGFRPATPLAVINLLDFYKIDLWGKNVVIVGRGNAVGKPLALMCLQRNATVTVCHTKTQNLANVCKQADILITACGVPGLITTNHVTENSIVIDVGLSFVDGKTCGDVSADVYDVCQAVTPVPRGIGPVTCVTLLQNLIKAHNNNK